MNEEYQYILDILDKCYIVVIDELPESIFFFYDKRKILREKKLCRVFGDKSETTLIDNMDDDMICEYDMDGGSFWMKKSIMSDEYYKISEKNKKWDYYKGYKNAKGIIPTNTKDFKIYIEKYKTLKRVKHVKPPDTHNAKELLNKYFSDEKTTLITNNIFGVNFIKSRLDESDKIYIFTHSEDDHNMINDRMKINKNIKRFYINK